MMGRLATIVARIGIAAVIAALPSVALGAGEGGGAGMPQFDTSTFASQLFWLIVTLGAFFFVMRKLALPRIGGALEDRRHKIDDDLEKAAIHREEAESAMQAYEKALADAAAEAQAIQRSTAQEIASATVERRAALAAKLADDTRAAESRIAAAMEPALASIQDIAAEVVRDAGARLADLEVSEADAAAAVTAAVKEAEA